MKFDMGKAWNQATEMLGRNFGLIATIIGLFYFLPTFAFSILFPELANPEPPATPTGADPADVFRNMSAFVQESWSKTWHVNIAITLLQYVGAIATLALFRRGTRPTVGEALGTGLRGMLVYIAAGLLMALLAGLVIGVPLGLAFAILPALGAILLLPAVVAVVYISVKFVLVPAVIAMEGERNPVAALKRSWRLTKGNSLRIFIFLFAIALVAGLIAIVANIVFSLVFSAMGEPATSIGLAFAGSLTTALFGALFLVVIGAIYRQLSAAAQPEEIATFD
ncbi:hypothetical protein [Qipengyuania nanhaisediminis]|uniref:hypothetical protein n=1 Tax=Qipengyuania nanhaisediminis TaxID=604088 RepID=UPI0038B2E03C